MLPDHITPKCVFRKLEQKNVTLATKSAAKSKRATSKPNEAADGKLAKHTMQSSILDYSSNKKKEEEVKVREMSPVESLGRCGMLSDPEESENDEDQIRMLQHVFRKSEEHHSQRNERKRSQPGDGFVMPFNDKRPYEPVPKMNK